MLFSVATSPSNLNISVLRLILQNFEAPFMGLFYWKSFFYFLYRSLLTRKKIALGVFRFLAFFVCFIVFELPAHAEISQITMSSDGVPFLLDTDGNVWGFKKPYTLEDPVKLEIDAHVKKIAPFIALSNDGRVYTWSLDKKNGVSKSDDNVNVSYTSPVLKIAIPIITDVTYATGRLTGGYFYALGQDKSIYEWTSDPVVSPHVNINVGYDFSQTDTITSFSTSGFTTAYLVGDGHLLGWGSNLEGQLGVEKGTGLRPIVLPDWPEYILLPEPSQKVFNGTNHTFILSNSGKVYVWGGCHVSGMSVPTDKPDIISGIQYPLAGIRDIAVSSDDNIFPNTFLRSDGSVWIGFSPTSSSGHGYGCGRTFADGALIHQLKMTVPAVAIAMGGNGENPYPIIALGADNTLWGANFRNTPMQKMMNSGLRKDVGFQKLSIDLDNQMGVEK